METLIFTFDSTHHALWAEEVAVERGVPVEVIPAPPEAGARCNLALQTLPDEVESLGRLLRAEQIPFRLHPPPSGSD